MRQGSIEGREREEGRTWGQEPRQEFKQQIQEARVEEGQQLMPLVPSSWVTTEDITADLERVDIIEIYLGSYEGEGGIKDDF